MNVAVAVQSEGEVFSASLVGAPDCHVCDTTADGAVESLKTVMRERVQRGELRIVELDVVGVSDLAGSLKDDPLLDEVVAEAYRLRDEERAR